MIRVFKTIGYILLDYIVRENLNLNVYLLRSNALFLWRQEDTSSLRLLRDVTKTGNGERGTGNGERKSGNELSAETSIKIQNGR